MFWQMCSNLYGMYKTWDHAMHLNFHQSFSALKSLALKKDFSDLAAIQHFSDNLSAPFHNSITSIKMVL